MSPEQLIARVTAAEAFLGPIKARAEAMGLKVEETADCETGFWLSVKFDQESHSTISIFPARPPLSHMATWITTITTHRPSPERLLAMAARANEVAASLGLRPDVDAITGVAQ